MFPPTYLSNFKSFILLPSFLGQHYDRITITSDGKILASMGREEFSKAHAVQCWCLYIFGISYDIGKDGKPLNKKVRNFFDFVSYYIWGLRQKSISSGTGAYRVKRINPDIQKLWTLCTK